MSFKFDFVFNEDREKVLRVASARQTFAQGGIVQSTDTHVIHEETMFKWCISSVHPMPLNLIKNRDYLEAMPATRNTIFEQMLAISKGKSSLAEAIMLPLRNRSNYDSIARQCLSVQLS